jgi:hypothetical protein
MFKLDLNKVIEEGRRLQSLEIEDKKSSPIKNITKIKSREEINDERKTKNPIS